MKEAILLSKMQIAEQNCKLPSKIQIAEQNANCRAKVLLQLSCPKCHGCHNFNIVRIRNTFALDISINGYVAYL